MSGYQMVSLGGQTNGTVLSGGLQQVFGGLAVGDMVGSGTAVWWKPAEASAAACSAAASAC